VLAARFETRGKPALHKAWPPTNPQSRFLGKHRLGMTTFKRHSKKGGAPGFCFTAKCTLYGLREKNGEILLARKRPQDDTLSGYPIRET